MADELEVEEVASGLGFPEGPVALDDGTLLFVDIRNGTLEHLVAPGEVKTVARLGGGPNGAAIGPDGAVWVCNNGGVYNFVEVELDGRQVTIPDPTGPAKDFRGGCIQRVDLETGEVREFHAEKGLLTPDDIVFDANGDYWFTDSGVQYPEKSLKGGLFRASIDGERFERVETPMTPGGWGLATPNGVGLAPASHRAPSPGKSDVLYVSDTVFGRLWALDLGIDGTPKGGPFLGMTGRVIGTLPGYQWVDSLKVLASGRICVGTLINGGVTVFDPETPDEVTHIPVDDRMTTNLAFGGEDMRDVWITASTTGRILKARWPEPGLRLHHIEKARLPVRHAPDVPLAETLVTQLYHSVGRQPEKGGMRPVHAFGVTARGHFTPSDVAARYCRAPHFDLAALASAADNRPETEKPAGEPDKPLGVPVTVRFSNGSGAAVRHDGWSDVRGMAVRFHLDKTTSTDLIAMTLREFFSSTPDEFHDFAIAAEPARFSRERPLEKIRDYLHLVLPRRDPYPGEVFRPDEGAIGYATDNPFSRQAVIDAAAIGAPVSYHRAAYFAVHTFVVTGPGPEAVKRWVRFEWQPVDGVLPIDLSGPGRDHYLSENFLDDALRDRLEEGPIRFLLMMTIGEAGDAFADPARAWPPHRPRIVMGTLTLDDFAGTAGEKLSFNPLHLIDGIEVSEDPVLAIRRDAYAASSDWRGAEPCPFAGEAADGG